MSHLDSRTDPDWWRGSVIYQIYPRSYQDTNGDGVGDLPGITQRLEYIASLGVDAIWLSPIFTSPMKDFGYDVSDYRDIDPLFGTLADFDTLVARAHALGLKVMIDQVLSHTSDEHPWFVESRQNRSNPKADWYVWADPKPDGTPPNNWLSIFGGSAWHWDARRNQYYMHNFLTSQPDLNFHHPEVQAQMLDVVKFWIERGVDGFRLDTANFYVHDAELRDNPPFDRSVPAVDGAVPANNPYGYQQHLYDKSQPENLEFMRKLRSLLDRYPALTTVGEIGADDAIGTMCEYTSGGDKLHMAYSFMLLGQTGTATFVRKVIDDTEARIGDGWPCWSLGNHDCMRVLSRWAGGDAPARARMLAAMLLSLRGSVCVYQGEELGLTEADIPFERIQDPYGIPLWPEFKGRDGCRTPMPWNAAAPHAGFSGAEPWLPVPEEHLPRAADRQQDDPHSVLNAYRRFLGWRHTQPALIKGSIALVDSDEPILAFVREAGDERVLCVFNFSADTVAFTLPAGDWKPLAGHGLEATLAQDKLTLPAFGGFFGGA
ncbi:alpha-glucosidase [Plasticicumulans lactativorans]|uniref:Alpha-glucosidase n=1 Tax=Plasticicumulans lactativorans TaxID=1133106 RepID=A0A4V2SBM1_9GAMM|nr:alpha-glucosidase family protein [Plasticicumulans lactativorans]TCO75990.1 alpha-glucosidase [Plasticicumulans lactativorans]